MQSGRTISPSWRQWMIAAVFSAAAAHSAPGQAVLTNRWLINPSSPFLQGLSTQPSGPFSTTVNGSYHFSPGADVSGGMTDISNYGNLFASGTGSATASPGDGSVLFVGNSSDTYVGAVTSYSDVLTIGGTGPVSILFTEVFSGNSTSTAGYGYAFVSDFLFVNGQLFTELVTSGSTSQVLTFNPGDQIPIQGDLSGGCGVTLGAGSPPDPASASCSYSGSGPLYLDVLTPGGSYTDLSGTQYQTLSTAPEPESYTMLLPGLFVVGLVARRRRQTMAPR